MKKTTFQPTLEGSTLESRVVLSHGIRPASVIFVPQPVFVPRPVFVPTPVAFVPAIPINTNIPYVVAPAGVSQAAINLTTLRVTQILNGGNGHGPGLFQSIAIFARNHNVNQLTNNLSRQAAQVPYGRQFLLSLWLNDAETAINSGQGVSAADNADFTDLSNYVQGNEGTNLNYLESVGYPFNSLPNVTPNGFVQPFNNVIVFF
jgi:hypothetical protein